MHHLSDVQLIIIFLCTLGALGTLLASFIIRYVNLDENKILTKISPSTPKSRYRFPVKEDKFARRNRWARVIGRGHASLKSLSHLQNPAITAEPSMLPTERLITLLVEEERRKKVANRLRRGTADCGSPAFSQQKIEFQMEQLGNATRSEGNSGQNSETGQFSIWSYLQTKKHASGLNDSGLQTEVSSSPPTEQEVQKLKLRIMATLIRAGPAKRLCAIHETNMSDEVDLEAPLCQELDRGHSFAGEKMLWRQLSNLLPWMLPSVGITDSPCSRPLLTKPSQESKQSYLAVNFDLEPVMVVGSVGVSREMLWLALAHIGGPAFRAEAELEVQARWAAQNCA